MKTRVWFCAVLILGLADWGHPFFFGDPKVFYHLYTKQDKDEYNLIKDISDLQYSRFNKKKINIFVVHGWGQTVEPVSLLSSVLPIKDAILEDHGMSVNVFMVHWTYLGPLLRSTIRTVSESLGKFIQKVQKHYSLTGKFFYAVGFGIGAHIAGAAGRFADSKFDRLIALDPGVPILSTLQATDRLGIDDATCIEVISTNAGTLGEKHPAGNIIFFPNGGKDQPGCYSNTCSHLRSIEYFIESLQKGTQFEAVECNSYESFIKGLCKHNQKSVMGGLDVKKNCTNGHFFLRTASEPPYALITGN